MLAKTLKGMLAATLGLLVTSAAQAQDKHKVFLSMSYIGNDWQAEAAIQPRNSVSSA